MSLAQAAPRTAERWGRGPAAGPRPGGYAGLAAGTPEEESFLMLDSQFCSFSPTDKAELANKHA